MAKDTGYLRIGEVLVASGLLTPRKLDQALALQRDRGLRLGEVIVQEGMLTQDQINWALSKHFGLPYVDVDLASLDVSLARALRPALLHQHRIIPLVQMGYTVTLAMADPTDTAAVREVADTLGCNVQCVIGSARAIMAAIEAIFTPEELHLAAPPAPSAFSRVVSQPTPRRRLGEILIDALLITEDQLVAALSHHRQSGKRLGEVLIEDGICTEDQINWALARHLDVPYIDISAEMIEPPLMDLVPHEFLSEHQVVPLMRIERQLVLAMADPLDEEAIAQVGAAARCTVLVAIAPRRAIENALRHPGKPPAAAASGAPPPAEPSATTEALEAAPEGTPRLSPDAAQAFKETIQHSPLPVAEKIRVYYVVHRIAKARQRGGVAAARVARQEAFTTLTPEGIKLALQLAHQVGKCDVPVLMDEEFIATYGRAGILNDGDRRFIVDRRVYERTILSYTQIYKLDPVQVDNAVMAARAHVLSGGKQKILLIARGEKELAETLTRIIHLAQTRESAPAAEAPALEPDRRATDSERHGAFMSALATSGLPGEQQSKVIRAFRFINQTPGAATDPAKLQELFRGGTFAGFSAEEIKLLERLLRIYGYDLG